MANGQGTNRTGTTAKANKARRRRHKKNAMRRGEILPSPATPALPGVVGLPGGNLHSRAEILAEISSLQSVIISRQSVIISRQSQLYATAQNGTHLSHGTSLATPPLGASLRSEAGPLADTSSPQSTMDAPGQADTNRSLSISLTPPPRGGSLISEASPPVVISPLISPYSRPRDDATSKKLGAYAITKASFGYQSDFEDDDIPKGDSEYDDSIGIPSQYRMMNPR